MTLIVLLILAAVSLSAVFSEKGIFNKAEIAGAKYNEAKAREVLETVLLADGQYEKNINPDYDEYDFLNELIINEIPGTEIKGDVAIISGWAFELDRSVPKIGRPLGKADKLVFPTVKITSGPTLIEKGRKAKFTAKMAETTKGITRIELWLDGKKIEKETKIYETPQKEIIIDFEVNKNGNYTVKAYADLMDSANAKVEGIVPAVSFSPNGSTEWKKQHTTKITVEETAETITSMKYMWVKDDGVNEPDVTLFTQNCPNNNIITGGNETMTGTYYLWVLLILGSGETQKTSMCASQGFKFDNEAPTVTLNSTPVSETSFTLTATANETCSEIARYEFYVNGKKIDRLESEASLPTVTIDVKEMKENIKCVVYAYDTAGNYGVDTITDGRTLLYNWHLHDYTPPVYGKVYSSTNDLRSSSEPTFAATQYADVKVNEATQTFEPCGEPLVRSLSWLPVMPAWSINGDSTVAFYLKDKSTPQGGGVPRWTWDAYRVGIVSNEILSDTYVSVRSTADNLYVDGEVRDGKKAFYMGLE